MRWLALNEKYVCVDGIAGFVRVYELSARRKRTWSDDCSSTSSAPSVSYYETGERTCVSRELGGAAVSGRRRLTTSTQSYVAHSATRPTHRPATRGVAGGDTPVRRTKFCVSIQMQVIVTSQRHSIKFSLGNKSTASREHTSSPHRIPSPVAAPLV